MWYTRKGDGGDTRLYGVCNEPARRISKHSPEADALGALDELNSFLGLCRAREEARQCRAGDRVFADILQDIQHTLFSIQAQVAGADKSVPEEKVSALEIITDTLASEVPPLKHFSLPGASEYSALLDISRAVARRAERCVVGCCETKARGMDGYAIPYLNRLSSVLFAMARQVNAKSGITEEPPHYQ